MNICNNVTSQIFTTCTLTSLKLSATFFTHTLYKISLLIKLSLFRSSNAQQMHKLIPSAQNAVHILCKYLDIYYCMRLPKDHIQYIIPIAIHKGISKGTYMITTAYIMPIGYSYRIQI